MDMADWARELSDCDDDRITSIFNKLQDAINTMDELQCLFPQGSCAHGLFYYARSGLEREQVELNATVESSRHRRRFTLQTKLDDEENWADIESNSNIRELIELMDKYLMHTEDDEEFRIFDNFRSRPAVV